MDTSSPIRTVRKLADVERDEILFALLELGTRNAAAYALGISVRTLQRKLKSYGLNRPANQNRVKGCGKREVAK